MVAVVWTLLFIDGVQMEADRGPLKRRPSVLWAALWGSKALLLILWLLRVSALGVAAVTEVWLPEPLSAQKSLKLLHFILLLVIVLPWSTVAHTHFNS